MAYCRAAANIPILIILLLLWTNTAAVAAPIQTTKKQETDDFIYIVQADDTLILIALRHNLILADVILANNLSNLNLIFPGQQLILPGVSPAVTSTAEAPSTDQTHVVQPGETLYGIANLYNVSIGVIVLANRLSDPNVLNVGQTLQIPLGPPPTPEPLMAPFAAIELSQPTIIQGRTLVVKVILSEPATLTGMFEGYPVFFNGDGDGQLWSMIAIHALAEPNVYPISLTAKLDDGTEVTAFENVTVVEGPYGLENIQLDESRGDLLDAELIRSEQEKLIGLWSQVSLRPRWEGPFWYPVDLNSLEITSNFGTRRSYNDGPATSFHGGTDFGGSVGTAVYASAAGVVVLAEPLTVRGNAVLIDHGMGLFSGYWHQSQIVVREGQEVQQGDLIGNMGNTGLVTGPHLHWEMRLNGVAVEPLQWVQETIP